MLANDHNGRRESGILQLPGNINISLVMLVKCPEHKSNKTKAVIYISGIPKCELIRNANVCGVIFGLFPN